MNELDIHPHKQHRWQIVTWSVSNNRRLVAAVVWVLFISIRHLCISPLNFTDFFLVSFFRLLSAYRNKFEKINPTFEFFTQKILSYNNHDVGRSSDLRPTFSEFLRFITDPEGVNIHLNEHWQSFHKLCHPCYINYDYIGHVETMTDDSKYVDQNYCQRSPEFMYRERMHSCLVSTFILWLQACHLWIFTIISIQSIQY